tara:strand:+ start:9982 stop:10317 length:336 start_codon:yes stop_codon:yes gene_type:complete
MNNRERQARDYFDIWNSKDIEKLKLILSKNVVLEDWEVSANGIDDVLRVNQAIFDAIEEIEATPITVLTDEDNLAICIIEIKSKDNVIEVVDILCWDEFNKISSIKAYRGH